MESSTDGVKLAAKASAVVPGERLILAMAMTTAKASRPM
jgi:hypothetical protein